MRAELAGLNGNLKKALALYDEAISLAVAHHMPCLLYTSDAADERSSVDLGGRRIIKKKKNNTSVTELRPQIKSKDTHTRERTRTTNISRR